MKRLDCTMNTTRTDRTISGRRALEVAIVIFAINRKFFRLPISSPGSFYHVVVHVVPMPQFDFFVDQGKPAALRLHLKAALY